MEAERRDLACCLAADDAQLLLAAASARHLTVACAESLTGGMLTARLVDIPGASAVVRGGIVAYALVMKTSLLGVSEESLARTGAVTAHVAEAMAEGVRRAMGADIGLATTGVAGPGPDARGLPSGTFWVAVAGVESVRSRGYFGAVSSGLEDGRVERSRMQVRECAVGAALALAREMLTGS
ncbi:CinA family protein [Devriesea agamarum]|uniref:CinA family protein n=1 Tax=Devriesea agamarum TaxID=472569 RepID=UPI00071DC27C|nr:CinA family protein [Devriesea agamarum]